MRKKIGLIISGVWVLAWLACAFSIVDSEPIVTGDNFEQVAQNAPTMLMKAVGCGMLAVVGGLMILWASGILSGKKSN